MQIFVANLIPVSSEIIGTFVEMQASEIVAATNLYRKWN